MTQSGPVERKSNEPSAQSTKNRLQPMLAWRGIRKLLNDPEDTRQVFVVLEALSGNSLGRNLKRFRKLSLSQRVLQEDESLLDRLQDREWLTSLPAGSLGQAYLHFTQSEQITADGLVAASKAEEQIADVDLRRFGERMRDMHDLWHVTSQYGRDTFGEVCLLGFTFAQTLNPGIGFIAVMGANRTRQDLGRGVWKALWQAYRDGRRAAWLPGQDWEHLLTQPLEAVREQLKMGRPSLYQSIFTQAQAA
jgi:ubiquinone biosynthesis protein COQ4